MIEKVKDGDHRPCKDQGSEKGEDAGALSDELASGEVYRRIELPEPIKTDRTKATFDKGTLRITAAKAERRTKNEASTATA